VRHLKKEINSTYLVIVHVPGFAQACYRNSKGFILRPRKAIVAPGTPHKAINTFGRPKSDCAHVHLSNTIG
jgi:hypothetical protein